MKKEAKWQTIFNQYLREKQKNGEMYGFYELKQTNLDYFPFNKIEEHQLDGLLAAEQNGLIWKFSDEDQRQKPFDCISMPPLPSYLVIKFPDGFYCMSISYIWYMINDGMTRITLEQARKKASRVIHIG